MSRQVTASVENSFVKGLITEATGLNFPENACVDADNTIFGITGEIYRRAGIDYETNHALQSDIGRTDKALSSYVWKNASGDGLTQIYVLQIGSSVTFYQASSATNAAPLSSTRMATVVDLTHYRPVGSSNDPSQIECQYADGNGYLFIFHPYMEPIYCSLTAGVITAASITVKTRDFLGAPELNTAVNFRPPSLSGSHQYNLNNQGWTSGDAWGSNSASLIPATLGSHTFVISAGLPIVIGQQMAAADFSAYVSGTVTAYAGTNLTVNIYATSNSTSTLGLSGPYGVASRNTSLITDFQTALGSYPANADVWWTFKNTSQVFSPATTAANVTLSIGNAPKGHFVLDTFNQLRSAIGSIPSLTDITTFQRPKTGAWFAGRVWYAGADASVAASGTAPYYTWTENIYFSQIITSSLEFGLCYQNNDPTSEDFADLLPSDGGVIQIQGCGSIYKLFPIQNGILVFATNGIWFITGSQGIGFTANDYTVTKISGVQCISASSFVNVLGYPIFWNEEGIYAVNANQQGGLSVDNICLGTILTFYSEIPTKNKLYARGDYNPLTYVMSWVFKSTDETSVSNRYEFDRVLNFNSATKAFYPYTVSSPSNHVYINDIKYIQRNSGVLNTNSTFKYLSSVDRLSFTFSEERDATSWVDFKSYNSVGSNYTSTFTTGYKLKGNVLHRWEPIYTYVFAQNNPSTAYKIQGIWDYAITGDSGRFSSVQTFYTFDPNSSVSYRRHKIRGHGRSLQLKFTSVDSEPFTIIGWAVQESSNATV